MEGVANELCDREHWGYILKVAHLPFSRVRGLTGSAMPADSF